MIEACMNKKLDDTSKIYLNEINEIDVEEQGVETKNIENEDVIDIYITEY